MTSTTKFPLGAYVGNPGGTNVSQEAAFESQYNAFVSDLGARPLFMNAFTDFTQDPSQWASNASYTAYTWALSGNSFVGSSSGTTPVVGIPLASNAGGWSNVDTFYQQIIAGHYDASYTGIVDAWAAQGYKTVQFRVGYEFDGNFMPWSPSNSSSPTANADFVAAFQHVANLIHSESTADKISGQVVWNPVDINWSATAPAQLYPGNQYVDIISTDVYSPLYPNDYTNWSAGGNAQISSSAWASNTTDEDHFWQYTNGTQWNPTPGLSSNGWSFQEAVNFALQTGKPLSISESGSGIGSSSISVADNPAFVQWLAGALSQAQSEGVTIQNVDVWDDTLSDGDWNFTNGSQPLSAAAWATYFGAGSGTPVATSSISTIINTSSNTTSTSSTPAGVTVGSGADSLVLTMSEDAWQGDAQFTVSVGGTQIGGTQTVTASHSAGQTETFTILGTFATGSNTATINFTNDAYGGSASTDRNLYVNSATINGTAVSGAALTEDAGGAQSFSFQQAATSISTSTTTPAAVTVGSGADSLVLTMSEDAWQGDAQFTVSVGGTQIGGTQTVTASHSAGQTETFTILGTFATGSNTATINFTNDAYGGSASTDRNLYVNSATINGTAVSGAALTEDAGGAQSFSFQQAATSISTSTTTPAAVTVGSGADSLVLTMSEDAWQGDAQFTVSVGGTQIGGTQTVTASHSAGQTETFTILGTFATGSNTATINFTNDAYGGSASTDRNLYVNSATINGTAVSGATLTEDAGGAQSFSFQQAATSISTSTTTPAAVTIGSGADSLVLTMSEDAWQGDAQFTVSVGGTQIGGTQTVTASHSAGQTETFTILGTFATGSNTAIINFTNDAYGGSASTDRNLYVNSATINGTTVSGAALTEYAGGAQSFSFQQAAMPASTSTSKTTTPSMTFTDSTGKTLSQATITAGTLDSGAWQTGLNNNVHQNATSGVDVISTESWGFVNRVELTDLTGHAYAVQKFVETDVHLGGGPTSGKAATLAITTAERGTIQIDSGNYDVTVGATSNVSAAAANTFAVTFGSGNETLSLTGTDNSTVANVHAGSGTATVSFLATNTTTVTGGSGTANINEASGTNTVIAGSGTLNVHDGSGHDLLVFHAGGGLISATGFSATAGDTVQFDASLQSTMHQITSAAGTMIYFGSNTSSGVMLNGVNSLGSSAIHFV